MSGINHDQTKLRVALDGFCADWQLSPRWSDFILYALNHPNMRLEGLEIVNGAPVVANSVSHRVRFTGRRDNGT